MKKTKTGFIQIRVSPAEKRAIQKSAQQAGMGISRWILNKALPEQQTRFREIIRDMDREQDRKYVLAELNDFLGRLSGTEFCRATEAFPADVRLPPATANYVAAMVEHAAGLKNVVPPAWTRSIAPPAEPFFGSDLGSIRLHLLIASPLPFRRRNIFVDAGLGDRV
jgi:uncharacterized protein (DUF1778 family)